MRKMALAAAAALTMVSGSALGADLAYRAVPAATVVAPAFDWNGFYIGVMGGGGWGRSRHIDTAAVTSGFFDVSGGFVGGTIGYNFQSGPLVFGIEGDMAWSGIRGSVTTGVCGPTCFTNLNWFGTARARVGYAMNNWLPYVTAGGAFGEVRGGITGCGAGLCGNTTRAGWTAGAGLEWMFAPAWSAKVEYLYIDLGNYVQYTPVIPVSVSERVHTAKVGINYHFNWGAAGPVVARY
ncbi:MAG: porin family protein [Variibacter sp.]|nr:porin family protein [Variibacter sp.]